ncbi:MAG: carbon starvation protein A [Erysipelotrichaceae bacterium]|nr:carbon starvation protein A [Erysipelotrichaceae bacterium]
MKGLVIIALAMAVLAVAYIVYGKYLEKTWGIDPNRKTPAYEKEDGEDYVPTPKFVVFSHQFSSIAGAGPVTGPIIALMFGWLPALIWILVGGIFFGAVHDFGALYASVKNEGKSMGMLIEQFIGKKGKKMFLLFAWLFTLVVIAAFTDIVAGTFDGIDASGTMIKVGGTTSSISMLFIVVAIIFGLFIKYKKPSQKLEFVIGIILLIVMIALGIAFPICLDRSFWIFIIIGYLFLASILPMWLLMQPRDYLTTFLLVGMIAGAVIGVFVANPTMDLPAFKGFVVDGKMIFPTLFVTIACGAVSGFHSLVSSGTSSKQISNEKDMRLVGFGAMLLEALLAVVALVVASSLASDGMLPEGTPFQLFSTGVSGFLGKLGVPNYIATCIMAMCVSALALTSLDSVARIGRMSLQELCDNGGNEKGLAKIFKNKYASTMITLFFGYVLALGGYNNIWPLFGASNQLLAGLVLISLAVFLKTTGRKGFMLWIPMIVMLIVTFTSLGQSIYTIINAWIITGSIDPLTQGLQLIFAILLVVLGINVAFSNLKKFKEA